MGVASATSTFLARVGWTGNCLVVLLAENVVVEPTHLVSGFERTESYGIPRRVTSRGLIYRLPLRRVGCQVFGFSRCFSLLTLLRFRRRPVGLLDGRLGFVEVGYALLRQVDLPDTPVPW